MHTGPMKATATAMAGIVLAGSIAGCAAPGGQYGQARPGDPCDVAGTALAGALAGAVAGAMADGRKGAWRGATVAGLAGAATCVAINAHSRKIRTAAQAEQDFIRARGRLPETPQVVSYVPTLSADVVRRGEPVRIRSVTELVDGRAQRIEQVREELVVYDLKGERIRDGSKSVAGTGAGRFENSFELRLPKAASQGMYAMKTNLYVNGRLMASRDLRTQLVWHGEEAVLLAMR